MLPATKCLLDLYKKDKNQEQKWELKNSYIRAIRHYGSQADAEALLPAFLEAAEQREELIEPLMIYGDVSTAQTLVENCFQGEHLRDGVPEDILHCLGYLGYTPVQQILWEYAKSGDYWLSKAACMGLINLPCVGLEREIEEQIKKCYGKSLFPEFIPALAIKTNNDSLLEEIFQLGQTMASTDCNGGIILGVALSGKKSFDLFKKIIWNPHWEAYSGSTGSDFYLYIGTQYLNISCVELYLEMKARQEGGTTAQSQQWHDFLVIEALLNLQIARPHMGLRFISEIDESYSQLYTDFFTWSDPNHDDSIIGLAKKILGDSELRVSSLYEIKKQLALRMEQEIEKQQF
ncbi:MAG TPA: hypothetical protein DCP31_28395 [Cyanobacteria bacterium UBA8543]|nr:hypothetical protein [Cyanobacteria bacterium UBA8543]